ncbi:MAG TPA: tRNA 2-thiouridine(34) synthase MnmA [Bacteroidales bacterium]|nr:tRNA 2-thiouridine(34) synthase MnmA [Bacteroidales bacterium]
MLAMSGGLDSSTAAILLLEQGYQITGITFRPYDSISKACMEKETGCCNADTLFEARRLADTLGFEHRIIDVRQVFKDTIIRNFIDEYMSGRTPNPCVLCNNIIKWGILLEEAMQADCEYIATGHYARIGVDGKRHFLRRGVDLTKDQSYFLWMLTDEVLRKTMFPLGDLTKKAVREIARSHGFTHIADKRESQEVCFIPDNDYRRFIRENVNQLPGAGNFIDSNGKILGKHQGYPFYTIGQRKGLQIALGEPAYVTAIIPETNTVVLGKTEDLHCPKAQLNNVLLNKPVNSGDTIMVKIRYKTPAIPAVILQHGDNWFVEFKAEARAVTPGQSAVFYENDDIIGGGVISKIS